MRIAWRALSLEIKNEQPTPKHIVDVEFLLMVRQESDIPILAWREPEWKYVPTLLPAFEAESAAAEQGDEAAWNFAWAIRHAFFYESRTICTRFELAKVAEEAGLDVAQFLDSWDSGKHRPTVLDESHRGWEELEVQGSPTFVLPSGKHVWNPGAASMKWGRRFSVAEWKPAECPDGDCLQPFRAMLDEVIAGDAVQDLGRS